MLFVTQKFLIFFAIVFTVYWAIPWRRPRVWLLLAASYYFYYSFNKWLALVVASAHGGSFGFLVQRDRLAVAVAGVR